jgi:hypothetical protein
VRGPHLFLFFLLLSNSLQPYPHESRPPLLSRRPCCRWPSRNSCASLWLDFVDLAGYRRYFDPAAEPRAPILVPWLPAAISVVRHRAMGPRHRDPWLPTAARLNLAVLRRAYTLVLRRSPRDPLFFAKTSTSSPLPPVAPTDGGWLLVPAVGFSAVRHRGCRTELGHRASSDATLLQVAAFGASKEGRWQTIDVVAARSTGRSCPQ